MQFGLPALLETATGAVQLRGAIQDAHAAMGGVGPATPAHVSQLGSDFSGRQIAPIRGPGGTTVREGVMEVVPRPGMQMRQMFTADGKPVPVWGQAEFSSSTTDGHAVAMMRQAQQMAKSGRYRYILLQRSWRTATGRVAESRLIPDVIGVRADGRVDAFEVWSDSDTVSTLEARLARGMETLPAEKRGIYRVIPPTP